MDELIPEGQAMRDYALAQGILSPMHLWKSNPQQRMRICFFKTDYGCHETPSALYMSF
ncbi:hypothetical protein [Erysipelothrix piscisicarius]|uniref:hypothetical protein n=1 Tax=Erysipelothrix piscisicarius TaxID=2485784 RepID=UPI002F94C046